MNEAVKHVARQSKGRTIRAPRRPARQFADDSAPPGDVCPGNKRLRTKTGAVRQVPVHPTLAKILADWKLRGWPELMGRQPGSEDLLMPAAGARRVVLGTMRNRNTWSHQTRRDLLTLGLRHRRGYDLRRTFISLTRTDGARSDLLKLVTTARTAGGT